ncbi:MAG: hypothetical protein IPM82_16630 [Saprospiraceae bacterium]|nr:hypothetical protein [Saprospiraceae bacterium]
MFQKIQKSTAQAILRNFPGELPGLLSERIFTLASPTFMALVLTSSLIINALKQKMTVTA